MSLQKPEHGERMRVVYNPKGSNFLIGDNYHARADEQRRLCEEGVHVHNKVEDECCPCFGCCSQKPRKAIAMDGRNDD